MSKIKKNLNNRSRIFIFFAFPILLCGIILGLINDRINILNKNRDVKSKTTKKYEYDYEYDDNWEIKMRRADDKGKPESGCKCSG